MNRMSFAVFSIVLFLAHADASTSAQGTYTAASCNQSDVNAVINGPTHVAVDGDVIQLPACSVTWTSGITVPSGIGITIRGTGTPNSTPATTGASASCGSTVIAVNGATAFSATPAYGASTMRLSCMALNFAAGGGSGSEGFEFMGNCTSSGCPNLRMDNLSFAEGWVDRPCCNISYAVGVVGDMFGVVDHNTINGRAGSYFDLMQAHHGSYLGVGQYGDNSWAQPENYGSANFLFFENNQLNNAGFTDNEGGPLERRGGGRLVARFNNFTSLDNTNVLLAWHGTETNSRARGNRTFEFYKNTSDCNAGSYGGCNNAIGARSGTGIAWGNTFTATSGVFGGILGMNTYRTQGNPWNGWGPCDGSSSYDTNDGVVHYSGTIESISGNTITVSGSPGWTTNQWFVNGAPYSVHDTTLGNQGAEISANTANTLTLQINTGAPGNYVPAVGDGIQILRATACIDQAGGRGAGILYDSRCVNTPGINYPTCTVVPANEAVSPSYLWMNATPSGWVAGADTARVIQNRDFYTETANQSAQSSSTSPFNGTSGMGHGTLAYRPTTCTRGVAYWVTDQNTLYQCSSTNTWTAYYTPYAYPHPLTTGTTTTALTAPTSLRLTVQ